MACKRCESDLQPEHFGNPRNCAFTQEGNFTDDNWNCATIEALLELRDEDSDLYGNDESIQIVPVAYGGETNGWLILTRYKRRGKTSSAVHVGDFWPPQPLTLEFAEGVLFEALS